MVKKLRLLPLFVFGLMLLLLMWPAASQVWGEQAKAPPEAPAGQAYQATPDPSSTPFPGLEAVQQRFAKQAKMVQSSAPKVLTLTDGTKVQRTPNDSMAYNTYFLGADNRGCRSCHADLGQLLRDMPFVHLDLGSMYGIDLNVNHCLGCHTYSPGYVAEQYGFGRLIHGIHQPGKGFTGNCNSCHDVSENDGKFHLWDDVKYDALRGIVDVPGVKGTFRFDQDVQTKSEDLFNVNWLYYSNDYIRYASQLTGKQLPQSVFDNWTVTIDGDVTKPFSMTLPALIASAPVTTTIMKMHCTMDPPGAALIENVTIKGIPLSWVLQKAGGVKSGATAIMPTSSDGFAFPTTLDHLKTHEAYLVYEINGKPLTAAHGYPLQMWVGGMAAPTFVKQLNEIKVVSDPVDTLSLYKGWHAEDGSYVNKPNVAVFYTKEGQIIPAGKPFTFEGSADAYDLPITSLEFSMDRGKTWTTFKTPNTTSDKWLYWYFTFTPDKPGAYVLMVRATTQGNLVSPTPVKLMVNAQ